MQTEGLRGADIFLDEASVMATENAIMAAVARARRDHDRQRRLRAARAGSLPLPRLARRPIDGIESNVLRIHGVERLTGGEWTIAPEHIEVGSFIGLAAVTNSDLTIDGVVPNDMVSILTAFKRLGIEVELGDDWLRVPPHQELVIQNDLGDQVPKIEDGPWPAFPADLTSIAVAVATQAWGTVLVFEKMFENRLFFVDKLVSMGARIIVCDPHRVVVSGPSRLYGQRLTSPDIRAGWRSSSPRCARTAARRSATSRRSTAATSGSTNASARVGAQIERVEA